MVRSQLYTPGGEFTLPDGFDYVGPYHVHVNQGAMVGGFHKSSAHDRLTPSTAASRSSMRNIMQQLSPPKAPTRRGRTRSSGGSGSGGYQ